jgi:hypothetical protein
MINGNVYDFESIKVQLPTGMVVMLESISYKDKKDDEVITGVHNLPVGIGRGEYSGECEIEISRHEFDKLDSFAATTGGFFNMGPISITASYGHIGQTIVNDELLVHFTERDFSASKGDKNLNVSLKGSLATAIITNGRPAYVEA